MASRSPAELYFCLRKLVDRGQAAAVNRFLQSGGSLLSPYDREALHLDAVASLGWREIEQRDLVDVVAQGGVPGAALAASHLIRYPGPALAEAVFAQLSRTPLPTGPESLGAHMALMCMAGVNGLTARLNAEADIVAKASGGSFVAPARLRDYLAGGGKANPSYFLPTLGQVPLETIYALYTRAGTAAPSGTR
jgi:hypothetical protein